MGGSFFAKYLSDYDSECQVDSITIYDPYPIPKSPKDERGEEREAGNLVSPSAPQPDEGQGPRVSSLTLADGSQIELGASVIYSDNRLVVEMMEGDSTLTRI